MPNTLRVFLLALLALLLAGSAHSQQPSPRPRERGGQQQAHAKDSSQAPNRDQRGTVDSPLVVKLIPAPRDQESLAHEAREREGKAASDGRLVLWTAVVGLATVALVGATIVNLWLLRGQGRDLEKQRNVMQRQADHLEEQAVQLRASVAQTKDTAERQLRAYVGRSGIPEWREWHDDEGWYFEFRIPIKNAGLTPASRIEANAQVKNYPFPLPSQRSVSHALVPRGTLGPGETMKVVAVLDFPLNQFEYEEVKGRRTQRVFLEGAVVYRDAFGRGYSFEFFERVEWHGSGILTYPESPSDEQQTE